MAVNSDAQVTFDRGLCDLSFTRVARKFVGSAPD